MPANSAQVNLDNLHLKLREIENHYEPEPDDLVDPDKPFLQIVTYDIRLEGEDQPVGHILLNIICQKHLLPRCRGMFWPLMDERSNDLMQLATDVFTDIGILRKDIYSPILQTNRILPWTIDDAGRLKDQPTLYIEELVIKPRWQNKGIGTWAIQNIFNTDYIRPFNAEYLMAWPTVLRNYESSHEYEDALEAKRQRIISFFRKVGFRRLGTTQFFMLSKDLSHPSRQLRPEDDLPFSKNP
ncbi:hypothetical protein SCHPADRAFT_1000872 [Schizopora paradoxa]|uniref:N-acetyltransferase domain-containing protein n=1 Tax=Schizopora paradoxa TaxID=27342 RepID=A0A0H2R9Q5_9AGAM|nr:hypothetical protein SCHPADRAFT_1000872 [Schizopora paradoxa]